MLKGNLHWNRKKFFYSIITSPILSTAINIISFPFSLILRTVTTTSLPPPLSSHHHLLTSSFKQPPPLVPPSPSFFSTLSPPDSPCGDESSWNQGGKWPPWHQIFLNGINYQKQIIGYLVKFEIYTSKTSN